MKRRNRMPSPPRKKIPIRRIEVCDRNRMDCSFWEKKGKTNVDSSGKKNLENQGGNAAASAALNRLLLDTEDVEVPNSTQTKSVAAIKKFCSSHGARCVRRERGGNAPVVGHHSRKSISRQDVPKDLSRR